MKYNEGDIIAVYKSGKIVEDEIAWVRSNGAGQYYHTVCDDYYVDDQVVGVIRDGKREPNDLFLKACERDLAYATEKMRASLAWPDDTT